MKAMRYTLAPAAAVILLLPSAGEAQVGRNLGFVDPNLATKEQLAAIPGAESHLVDAIIKGRPYLDMLALDKVVSPHVSAEKKVELYRKLFIPINLNAATDAEIMLVPGMGKRMLHEFNEYRPYASLAVFNREIGKYVNAAEVARLAQYVFVPVELNSATDEQILSIPGVGPRMLREFKEYRPWKTQAQFQREIGKYVSKDEVARLWRYVTIKP
jgi:DNA uptake protein ComE-like DNA-binding protein